VPLRTIQLPPRLVQAIESKMREEQENERMVFVLLKEKVGRGRSGRRECDGGVRRRSETEHPGWRSAGAAFSRSEEKEVVARRPPRRRVARRSVGPCCVAPSSLAGPVARAPRER
jgi:hypothetical protein